MPPSLCDEQLHNFVSCSRQDPLANVFPLTGLQMPSRFFHGPERPDDAYQAEQKREFDRWRNALEVVKRLREAGIGCHLKIDDDRH
jgi:hypothetical protein